MTRLAFLAVTFALLATWADAQTAPPVSSAERRRLMHANHDLLDKLLDRGLALGTQSSKLDRAGECGLALTTLVGAIDRATEEPAVDADRVAELTDYLADLAQSGLAPTLAEVRADILANGSPGQEQLTRIESAAATDLTAVQTQFLLDPRLANSPKLADCRQRLRTALAEVRPGR